MDNNIWLCSTLYTACVLWHIATCFDSSTLSRCTDTSMDNAGYSSVQRNGQTLWSHCGFPSPKLEQRRCGRTFDPTVHYNLCDPGNIINVDSRSKLDINLWLVEKSTPYQCTPWHGAVLNYTIIVVTVQYLRIPDLTGNNTCKNNCGEIVPDMDESTRSATDEEKQLAIDTFTQGLVGEYESYFCDSLVVIAYWQNASLVATGLTNGMKDLLPASFVQDIMNKALQQLDNTNIKHVLDMVIEKYKSCMIPTEKNSILMVLLPICIGVLLIGGVVIVMCITVGQMVPCSYRWIPLIRHTPTA